MNLLFAGKGTSGSWRIRGEQLGHACNGTVKPKPTLEDCKAADVIVVVKRLTPGMLQVIRQAGKPWVWDVVDFYPQPACTAWSRHEAVDWVRKQIRTAKPSAVIWPNRRMREDCEEDAPGMVLYHHHRPAIPVNPVRERIKTLAYEGSERYVGRWLKHILRECDQRGWNFHINSGHLASADVVLAIRDEQYCGYAQRHWKSNVKLANAHGSGTPFIGPGESGYTETASGLEKWVESPEMLKYALDELEPQETRQAIHRTFRDHRIHIEDCATRLKEFIRGV